jgi:hypothetical protein
VRKLAGEPSEGRPGRKLPVFDKQWVRIFGEGHQKRIRMWKTANEKARRELEGGKRVRARL